MKVPILMTHHFRASEPIDGKFLGAISDLQAARVGELISAAGQRYDYQSHPTMGHFMHVEDPDLYERVVTEWIATL